MEIRAENLGHVYNQGTPIEVKALESVAFALPSGAFLGILGGNASGKTTLVKIIAGLIKPSSGRVILDGKDASGSGPGLKRGVGLVFERPERQLFGETVYGDISFVLQRFSNMSREEIDERVRSVCQAMRLEIEEIGDRSPFALSLGEQRRVGIAGVLVSEPDVLILDEPGSGLDASSVSDLATVLAEIKASGNRSVMIVSHDMEDFLDLLDLIMVLDGGRIALLGSPADVCRAAAGSPEMRAMLPPLMGFAGELWGAGVPLDLDQLNASSLADQIETILRGAGGAT
jgi:energy-coupling factor transport system ATP-binding protein